MATASGRTPRMRWVGSGIVGAAVVAGACWLMWQQWQHAPPPESGGGSTRPVAARNLPAPWTGPDAAIPHAPALPPALAGSEAPRLPVDAGGHLARRRAVRDFFDYCLTAQNQLKAAALDRLVEREITAQLDGMPARAETLDLWPRYRAYLAAVAALQVNAAAPGATPDPAALEQAVDMRAALASRELGAWAEPFFAADFAQLRDDAGRLRIVQDPTLSDAQRQARLAALDQEASPEIRMQREREQQQSDVIARIAQLQRAGASPGEMSAQLVQTAGPEVAARALAMQQSDDAWQATYAGYAAGRDAIRARGLSPEDARAEIAALRQRAFPDPADARRAASLDGAD